MQCVRILLKQSKISNQTISKYRKNTLVLYLVAHIENIVFPIYFEEIIKYFIKYWRENHSAALWKIFLPKEQYFNVFLYKKNLFKQDSKDSNVTLSFFVPYYFHVAMDLKNTGKGILTKFLKILSPNRWHFHRLWNFLSCVQWPTWSRVSDRRCQKINKLCLPGKQEELHKSTRNCWAYIPLQKMVSLLVSAHFIIVSLTDCTHKVPLFDLESSTKNSADFSSFDSWNLWCTHSRIWVPTLKQGTIWPWIPSAFT